MNTTQFRPDYFSYLLWSKGQNFFPTLGGQIRLFYLQKLPEAPPPATPSPAESNGCAQNKPGYKRSKL